MKLREIVEDVYRKFWPGPKKVPFQPQPSVQMARDHYILQHMEDNAASFQRRNPELVEGSPEYLHLFWREAEDAWRKDHNTFQ